MALNVSVDRIPRVAGWLAVILPFALFGVHAAGFGRWIFDDAAISYSYATSLAHGHGLVAQPGVEPVEGYSNFTWVLLWSAVIKAGLFDPVVAPKVAASLLVLGIFVLIRRILALLSENGLALTAIVLCLLALNTSFVVWTMSGLENPLYALVVTGLLYGGVLLARDPRAVWLKGGLLGSLGAIAAMTRPDGIMYAAVLPAVWVIQLYDRACAKRNLRALLSYLPVFGALYGAFLLFRFWYFHDWVPNTYYAKGGPSLRTLLEVALFWPAHTARTHALFSGVAGPLGMFVWVLLCGGTIWAMAGSKDYKKEHFVPFAFLICSMAVYLLLPEDGAGEYRYATPFFVLVYVYLFVLADLAARQTIPWVAARQLVFLGFTLAVMGGSVMVFSHRSEKWARSPCVPMEKIAFEALRFDRYSALLGIKASSVLLPDVGGTLYHSSYRVVDLAGLCDRTVARTLRRDTAAFHEYIFGKVKPTFIHTHTDWSYLARLDDDPRFRRDYIPIWETPFRFMNDSVGVIVYSGDYVRRDLVNASPEIMAALAAGPGRFSPGK